MSTLVQWFNGLPDFVRRAIRTFLQAFVGTFGIAFLGWMAALQEAVSSGGPIPDPSVLGALALSAFVGAANAAVTSLWNYAEEKGWVKPMLKDGQSPGANPGADQ